MGEGVFLSGFDHPDVNADYEINRILKDTEAFLKRHPPSSAAIVAHQQQLRQQLPRMGGVSVGGSAKKSSRSGRRFLAKLKLWQLGLLVLLVAALALGGWAIYTELSSHSDSAGYDDYDQGSW